MLKSKKQLGKNEKKLMAYVQDFFQKKGYYVQTHSRLNIAWSSIISDVDLIAFNDDEVIITEIKSKKDHIYRALQQLEKVKGFSDKLYVATDTNFESINFNKWDDEIGLLIIKDKDVTEIKSAKKIKSIPKDNSIAKLKKKCLVRLSKLLNIPRYLSKKDIEEKLRISFVEEDLKKIVKEIAICSENCEDSCILEPFFIKASNNARLIKNAVTSK